MADNILDESPIPDFFDFRGLLQNDTFAAPARDRWLPRRVSKLTSRCLKIYLLLRNRRCHDLLSKTIDGALKAGIITDRRQHFLFGSIRHKYLRPYLSLNLTHAERFSALQSYHLLILAACGAGENSGFKLKSLLWQNSQDRDLYLLIEQATDCRMEGELTLSFFAEESRLYWLTISIFDGRCIGLAYEKVLYVGGVQGLNNSRDQARAAAKSNGEVAPLDMLMIAVRSLANAFRAEKIIGVTKANHVALDYAPGALLFDYDAFWAGQGGVLTRVGYVLDIDPKQKPLCEVPSTHRSRTRRKRELKANMSASIDERASFIFPGLRALR